MNRTILIGFFALFLSGQPDTSLRWPILYSNLSGKGWMSCGDWFSENCINKSIMHVWRDVAIQPFLCGQNIHI